jgi:hypothetical protein
MDEMSALFFFLLAFPLLLQICFGTIAPYRDSGDLLSASATLGIAHPPGYALYILIHKIIILILPLGNVAYRLNVSSALVTAGAAAILFYALRRIFSFPSALIAALFFFLSPATLKLGMVSEMYALNGFLRHC